jgi:hypothetical protein
MILFFLAFQKKLEKLKNWTEESFYFTKKPVFNCETKKKKNKESFYSFSKSVSINFFFVEETIDFERKNV